jgi:lactoylglutathione lyase
MPLLFAYGTLQQVDVQLAAFGRRLEGEADELVGFERSSVPIQYPQEEFGGKQTHYANVTQCGRPDSRVAGTAFEVSEEELAAADRYEQSAAYRRITTRLASGRDAWVYVDAATSPEANLRLAVPFFGVTDIEASLRFYRDGLGFTLTRAWEPEGRIRWCWIERDGVALMLQEYWKDGRRGGAPAGPLSQGASVCIMCRDAIAIYHEAKARGLSPKRPLVGNGLWVTSFTDPDGYRVDFESPTDAEEETLYSDEA